MLFLEQNVAVCKQQNPGLLVQLDQARSNPPRVGLEILTTASGHPTIKASDSQGQEYTFHAGDDPLREEEEWLSLLNLGEGERLTYVIFGCGLGYHVAELLDRRRGGLVVVLERHLPIVHAALRCHDFHDDICLHRLVLIHVEERMDLFGPLAALNMELMLGLKLLQHPASGRAYPTACAEVQRNFTEYTHFARSSMVTALQISATSCENILQNLPYYLGWPDISLLKDTWKGLPGICVAAGPSLRKNMHLLGGVKGKVPIIAVQTVLKTLLSAGIRPDFITALDWSQLSRRFYEDLDGVDDVTLVADPKVNPVVTDSFPGPVCMFHNPFADRILAEIPDDHDTLQAGSTVAHLNLYLARYMGCDPIVLIGQDLGFGENVYYAPGTPIQVTWSPELNRFNSMEMMEWQRIVRMRTNLRKVPGQRGGEIFTDAQMFTYLQQFERDVAATDVKVINATEGGARIAGAEEMDLAEVLRRYCRAEKDTAPPPPRRRDDAPKRLADGIDCLTARLAELDRMEEICDRVLSPLREMTAALDEPDRFNRLHADMNRWRLKIDSFKRIYQLVADTVQLAEMKRLQLDKARDRKDLDEIATRRDQLARDIQYVSILREGVGVLRKSVTAAMGRLEAAS